jgi:hypothetical protein
MTGMVRLGARRGGGGTLAREGGTVPGERAGQWRANGAVM